MAERRFPRPDADFGAYMRNYYDAVKEWWDAQGLSGDDLKPLENALDAWKTSFPAHRAAQQQAQAARQAKDAARAALQAAARPITNFIQSYPATTDAARAAIGITVRDATATPAARPTSRPLVIVLSGQRLTHTLRISDEATPTRRARPRGVPRAEVFVALTPPGQPAPPPPGDAHGDPGAYRYSGSVTRGETTLAFAPDQGGLQAHYLARWVSTSGATGPWSDTASATVAA